jgi:hypothetical protein
MTDGCVHLLYKSRRKFLQQAAGQLLSGQPVLYKIQTFLVTLLQPARRAAVSGHPSSLRIHWVLLAFSCVVSSVRGSSSTPLKAGPHFYAANMIINVFVAYIQIGKISMLTKFKSVNQLGEKESAFRKMLIRKAGLNYCTKKRRLYTGSPDKNFSICFSCFFNSLFAKLRIDMRQPGAKKSPNLAYTLTPL